MCREFGGWPGDALLIDRTRNWHLWMSVNFTVYAKGKTREAEEIEKLKDGPAPVRTKEELERDEKTQNEAFEEMLSKVGRGGGGG
jgi:hypothetical protein